MDRMVTLEKWQDEYLDMMKKVEEPVVRYTGEMAGRMVRFVPQRPMFMKDMPTMPEFVENQLKFRKRVVDEQARFVRRMMKAMDPVFEKRMVHEEHKPEKAATVTEHMAPRRARRVA